MTWNGEAKEPRSSLEGRGVGRFYHRTIDCPMTFEDRFYDPDHPKDTDWVMDIDYDQLFAHRRSKFLNVTAER
jgi:hypothetical protein